MATNSTIEWTESTFEQNFKTAFQFVGNSQTFGFNPFKHIFIFLRRIAGRTSRNNVLNFGMTALRNRNYMIESRSSVVAVSAFSVKFFQNIHLSFRRYRLTPAFAAVSVLSSFAAVFLARRIPDSGIFGFVRFAQTVFNYKFRFRPFPTFTTPTQTFLKHQPSFTNADSVCFWFIVASSTFAFQIVKTRKVFSEEMNGFPFFANCAFFQTSFPLFQVIGNGNTGFLRGAFNRSIFGLSHIISGFRHYNSTKGEIIL